MTENKKDKCVVFVYYQKSIDVPVGPEKIVDDEPRLAKAKKNEIIRNWKKNQELDDEIKGSTDQENMEKLKDDKPKLVLKGEALKQACNSWIERVTQFRRTIEWNEDEKSKERNSYLNSHDLHINLAETEKSANTEICTSNPEEPLSRKGKI
ncbi:12806_t:CDS:1, partial [Gigaspora margarita]